MNPLTYIGPADPGPPPSGWFWYERATGASFFQIQGNDVLIPFPPVLFTAGDLKAARAGEPGELRRFSRNPHHRFSTEQAP